jgi:hypothetical protein
MRDEASERAAMQVTDEFMRAFNARDMKAHFATFNFPHVRIASGRVRVFQTQEELAENPERYGSREVEAGWHHSRWDSREVIHSSPDKVHLKVQFTRYGADDRALNTYLAVYVITKLDGRWGIQARSSTAP